MTALPVAELAAPLGEERPCGGDLEYDSAFVELVAAAQGKPEQQYGDTLIAAEPPDWRAVYPQSLELARRTRDLRILVLLARAGARLHGLATYADALAVIATLLETQWEHVHPQLDRDDGDDPTMRLNALAPLVDLDAGLADLRAASVGGGRSALTVRQIEIAFGAAAPHDGEALLPRDGAVQALEDSEGAAPGTLALLPRVLADIGRIESLLGQRVGGNVGPDFRPLRGIARALAEAGAAAGGSAVAVAQGPAAAPDPAAPAARRGDADIASRDDVVRLLERACVWIERNEPSNPAPLLIRRAQRLMSKSFLEIVQDLLPDGVSQVEKLAGVDGSS